MTTLHNGFALKQIADYYGKVQSALIEVLTEYVLAKLLHQPIDEAKWQRKVFKVYKTMNMLEKKKHTKPLFCKRMFKLIFALYQIRKGLTNDEIWATLEKKTGQEDDINETQALNVSHISGLSQGEQERTSLILSGDSVTQNNFSIRKYSREDKIDNRERMIDTLSGGTISNNNLNTLKISTS